MNVDLDARLERFPLGASLTLSDLAEDPVGLTRRLREQEPVSWLADAGTWLVASRALVEEVTRDQARFTADSDRSTDRQVLGRTMLTTDGPDHELHRKPFDRSLRVKHVHDAYTEVIDARVTEILRGIQGEGRADLMADLAEPLGLAVVGDVLGFGFPDQDVLAQLLGRLLDAMKLAAGDDARARANQVRQEFAGEVTATLERALRLAPESVLGTVARERSGDLSDEIVVNNTVNLIFGGAETTATLLGTSLWALLHHPAQLDEVRADAELIPKAVDEAARWHSPFGIVLRWATQDTTIGDVAIGQGEQIYPLLMGANRDPAMFPDPDRFDLHRPNARQSSAFGRGLHFCIGQNLARLVACRAIVAALAALPGLRLDPERPSEPQGFEFHRLEHFHVIWEQA